MKNCILTIGKPKANYIALGLSDYVKRLQRHGGCELAQVKAYKAAKATPDSEVKEQEAGRILARIGPRDMVWALDPGGSPWFSEQWAAQVEAAKLGGHPRLVLVIGGALGLGEALLARADHKVSLGPATMAHEIAALAAAEQLYRAHMILAGTPYHRA